MKGFLICSIFAVFYILIILLFQASAQQFPNPTVNPGPNANFNPGSSTPGVNQPSNITTGIVGWLESLNWDVLGISNPAARQSINNVYGSWSGDLECQKKSMCILGNYLRNVPGRDLIFFFLNQYVPQNWGILYDVFRISVMYGQNCELFVCQPMPPPPVQAQTQVPIQTTPVPVIVPKNTTKAQLQEEELDNEIHKNPKIQNKPNVL